MSLEYRTRPIHAQTTRVSSSTISRAVLFSHFSSGSVEDCYKSNLFKIKTGETEPAQTQGDWAVGTFFLSAPRSRN